MPMLAFDKAAVDGLSVRRRKLLRAICSRLDLGVPAVWSNGSEWYVFCDTRIDLVDVARLGVLAANWSALNAVDVSDPEVRRLVREKVNELLVWPDMTDVDDSFAVVLAAQGAPSQVRAFDGFPDGWTPVEGVQGG